MSDAAAPSPVRFVLPTALRQARGVAMSAGLLMTPLMIAAGLWADRAALKEIGAAPELARAELRATIAPGQGER